MKKLIILFLLLSSLHGVPLEVGPEAINGIESDLFTWEGKQWVSQCYVTKDDEKIIARSPILICETRLFERYSPSVALEMSSGCSKVADIINGYSIAVGGLMIRADSRKAYVLTESISQKALLIPIYVDEDFVGTEEQIIDLLTQESNKTDILTAETAPHP